MTFKYIELFAGIGGFRSALDGLGGECVFASEIDKYASQAYRALYNGASELHGDITKVDAHIIPDHDVLVGGFPCQAFSVAGQRKGFEDARGTLFFEIARIASTKQPRLMLLENVKGLLSHDGGKTFETMCAILNDIGYAIDFRVLNSKHFGVPQNRERIFVACDRDAEHAEWDVTGSDVVAKAKRRAQALGIRTFNFDWPENSVVTTRLRDVLETQVDERYYLSEEKTAKLIAQISEKDADIQRVGFVGKNTQQYRVHSTDGIMPTMTAQNGGGRNPGGLIAVDSPIIAGSPEHYGNDQMNRVYSVDGLAPTITVVSGGGREQKIAEPQILDTKPKDAFRIYPDYCPTPQANDYKEPKQVIEPQLEQYSDGSGLAYTVDANYAKGTSPGDIGKGRRTHVMEEVRAVLTPDREEKRQNGRRFKDDGEESFTLTAQDKHGVAIGRYPRYRIRKLTPRECWRLQGFTDAQHDTVAAAGISDSQRYKQAGNAVTVNVIRAVGRPLVNRLKQTAELAQQASASSSELEAV
ncbi:DNA (cytosine-5-)-methyltransferase [Brevibacillus reuszeri]|uniref:DNA (cytosine-5-)-methyltransferase n=1 Tax=Brevibacillus reuszeri TaxID=54915 RepID=UPI001F395E94|nr:DNA (cytosine-5-)-methyltransferase [Brevibacillus reuszeri]